jgi:hypothetical protein
MLDDYVKHIESRQDSLLARIYGIYTIKTEVYRDLDLIIMQNGARIRNKAFQMYQFDLKGSTVNRYTPFNASLYLNNNEAWADTMQKQQDDKALDLRMSGGGMSSRMSNLSIRRERLSNKLLMSFNKGKSSMRQSNVKRKESSGVNLPSSTTSAVLKDTNLWLLDECLAAAKVGTRIISVQQESKEKINKILQYDSAFMARWNIMDYSLFLVVERRSGALHQPTRNEFLSADGTELFHVSIIDYLQEWNFEKKVERFLKSFKPNVDVEGISAVEPETYRKRFIDAMQEQVFKLEQFEVDEGKDVDITDEDYMKTIKISRDTSLNTLSQNYKSA